MTIKNVIKTAAAFFNSEDVISYLDEVAGSGGESTLKTVNLLTRLANLVISELAATYIPMTTTERVNVQNGKIVFADLTYNVTRVLSVKTVSGAETDFAVKPEYAEVKDGAYDVEYEYAPPNYGLTDEIGFGGKVTAVLLGYGLAAEYCITQGRFEEAVMWRKRYTFGVERLVLPKNAVMKGRCWL